MKKDYYICQLEKNKEKLKSLKDYSMKYIFLRALISTIFLLFVYLNIVNLNKLYFTIMTVCIIIFVFLVYKHHFIKKDILYYQQENVVLMRYIKRFDNQWYQFEETGEPYQKDECYIDKDLDLLGRHSLFQWLNIAKTRYGKENLANILTTPNLDRKNIEKQQKAIHELAENKNMSIHIQTLLEGTNKYDDNTLIENFIDKLDIRLKGRKLLWLLRMVSLSIIFLSIIQFFNEAGFSILFLCILINLSVSSILGLRYSRLFQNVHQISNSLSNYYQIFILFTQTSFNSSYLIELQNTLNQKEIIQSINKMRSISEWIKQRQNAVGFCLLNGLILYDLLCVERLYLWQKRYQENLLEGFKLLAKIETLLSLAIVEQTKETHCYPVFNDCIRLNVENIYHPLMIENQAVGNDFQLHHQANIITGSNMSGKTTFLRTLAVNMILAYTGAAICANKAELPIMKILSSMRIVDELSSGTSTFYAELNRIKKMIDESEKNQLVCCFIDEIFKGTNSADRIIGAKAAIERLIRDNVLLFVSTHDEELCDLESELPIDNYHFKEYYKDRQIFFDYKIQHGRSLTTNAKFLLEMVGIIKK